MGRRAVVLGGGTIGLAASLALRAMGCEDITLIEPHPVRQSFLADVCGETVLPAADRSAPLFIDAVGSILKEADYRSAYNYLNAAKKYHIKLGHRWDDALDMAAREYGLSTRRGLGPPRQSERALAFREAHRRGFWQ